VTRPTEPAVPEPPAPPRDSLVGPLAGWELTRLARRGHAHRTRELLLYILFLTFAGFAVYWFWGIHPADLFLGRAGVDLRPDDSARFANAFAMSLLLAQLAVVIAVTPYYAAAAIAEEKDRQTLPLLLTTGLSDREIVWGKAAGRAAFVLAAVLAGTPVLMITLLFGGVDVWLILAALLITASTAALTSAVGVYAGCTAPDLRSAILRAYGLTVVFVCGLFVPPFVLSPFVVVYYLQQPWPPQLVLGVGYPLLQLAAAWAVLASATRALRQEDPADRPVIPPGPPPRTAFPAPPRPAVPPALVLTRPVRLEPLPPVSDDNPVLWKERHVGSSAELVRGGG
jgi:hypothetical protein